MSLLARFQSILGQPYLLIFHFLYSRKNLTFEIVTNPGYLKSNHGRFLLLLISEFSIEGCCYTANDVRRHRKLQ